MTFDRYLFQVSTGSLFADLQANAGISSSRPSDRRTLINKAFQPLEDISAFELAQVFILFKNMAKDGQMLSEEEFETLPDSVARHFKDQ